MKIGSDEQKILKGIAIIGMMMLHFWTFPNWVVPEYQYKGLLPNGIYSAIGAFGNFCVSIFAILTGYSFSALSEKWDKSQYRCGKIISFLVNYWVYVAIYLFIGISMREKMPSFYQLFINMFGLETTIESEWVCVPFAWYVFAYLTFILLYPLIKRGLSGKWFVDIFCIIACYFALKAIASIFKGQPIISFYFDRIGVLVEVLIGFCISKYNLFFELYERRKKNKAIFWTINLFIILLLVFIRVFHNQWLTDWYGIIYAIYISWFIVWGGFNRCNVILTILKILGQYSMGMWFISGLFFMNPSLQSIIFFLRDPIAILIWVIIVSFVISFIITNAIVKCKDLLEKCENN